jgi:RimJ/RimL family protein N-acetyltransferase
MLRHGKIAVGVLYNWFTTGNICMHIATDGLRRWIPRDYLWTSFRYPFWQLGCRRVTGLIDEHNLEARRLAVHLGFELETRLSQAMSDGDMLVYRMWKEDCRYLTWRAPHEHSENAVCA